MGATVTVASASAFGIQRTDGAWTGGAVLPRNEGVIQLNGGSFDFFGSSPNLPTLANDRSLSNAATGQILGNGTIEAGILNAGSINANSASGTLYVDNSKTAAGANIWGIQNLGTIVINTNNTLVLNRTAADWAANEGLNDSGTLRFNGGVYQGAIAGAINKQVTNFVAAGGIYGNGTFDAALDAQSGTLSAEGGTLNFTHAVMNNVGNGVTAQAIGTGNVLQFFGGASLSASSSLKANSGGEIRFTGPTNSTVAGLFDNTGGFLTVTGASVVFFTNNFARANLGTITLVAGGNFNYGGVGDIFTNAVGATVRAIGSNGSSITGELGGNNLGFINRGSLSVESGGTLTVDPRDAFIVGFSNASTGSIIVKDQSSTFAISRTTTAWGGGDTVKNEGTIIMNGGTFATFDTGGTSPNTSRLVQNDGTVQILGTAGATVTFQASMANGGLINVSTGLFTMVSPVGTTFTNLSSGTFRAGSETTRFTTNGNAAASVNNVLNAGTFSFENGTLAAGNFVNTGVYKVNLPAFGTFTISGTGNLFSNASSGSIFVSSGTNAVTSTVVNLGLIDGYGSGTFGTTSANFTNAVGGLIINTNSTASLSLRAVGDRFFNLGIMTVANGGTLNVINTGVTGTSGGSWLNQGALNVGDASSSGFFNSGQINNAGAINGRGVIGLSTGGTGTPLANSGSINVLNNGLLVISNFASSVSGSQFTNSGLVNIGNAGSELRLISGIANGTGGFVGITNFNSGTILVNGGTLSYISTTEALLTNDVGGWIKGSGTITNAFIANRGTIVANGGVFSPLVLAGSGVANSGVVSANVSAVVVKGAFNNSGTFAAIGSVGTFNGAVVNSGAWITDPSTLVFQNTFTVTSSAYVQMSAGDTYIFTNDATSAADYVNLSSKSNLYTTASGKFIFANTLGLTQNLVVAGINLGPGAINPPPANATNQLDVGIDLLIPGFTNNFALGTLQISDFTTVRVTDAFSGLPGLGTNDGLMAGLYLNNLEMGIDSLLIISSNVQVYFEGSNSWNSSNFLLEGNPTFDNSINGLHQLAVIPEPGVVFLWLCGFVTAYAARRRARNQNRG